MKRSYIPGFLLFLMVLGLLLLSGTFSPVQYQYLEAKGFDPGISGKASRYIGEARRTNNFSISGAGEAVSALESKKLKALRASVIEEPDGMITPGDRLKLDFRLLVPEGTEKLTIRFYSASRLVPGFLCKLLAETLKGKKQNRRWLPGRRLLPASPELL